MATISRVPVEWNGLTGLPGVSVFYAGVSTNLDVSSLVTFFNAIRGLFPPGLSWTVPAAGDTLDSVTGGILGSWTATGAASVNANGTAGPYAAGVGCRIFWNTTTVVGRRRLRGSTFMVPLLGSTYDSNGTINAGPLSTIQTAANALVASGVPWQVWHRPRNQAGGVVDAFNGAIVPDRVATLRSRRI